MPKPADFSADCASLVRKTIAAVEETYGDNQKDIVQWWQEWSRVWAPKTDSATDFVEQLKTHRKPYTCPLRQCFLKDFEVHNPVWDDTLVHSDSILRPDNIVPERILALAMPSVITSSDRNPPPPRVTATNSSYIDVLVTRYTLATRGAYEGALWTLKALQVMLRHRVYADRGEPLLSGKLQINGRL
jgi:hypothetical protein